MELAPFLESHGRTFTGGHCESVGIGGFLLQGGQGWNSRRWGWGSENVLAVDVVTADGELVHADADENADLYWAARGAGPGVLRRRHPLPPAHVSAPSRCSTTRGSSRLDDLEPMLEWLHDVLPTLDRAVEPVMAATRLRTGEPELLLHTTLVAGDAEALALRRSTTRPAAQVEHVRGPTTIAEENAAQALQNPEGHRYCADCQWTNAGAPSCARCCAKTYEELPTRHSFSIWYGWAPTGDAAGHGVLARGQRLPRDLRHLGGPGGGRAAARLGPRPPRRARRAGGGGALPRRLRLHPPARPLHGPRAISTACAPSAGRGTPRAVSSAISVSNGRSGRRPRSASAR